MLGVIFNIIILSVLTFGLMIFLLFSYYGSNLPTAEEIENYKPSTISRVYDSDGNILGVFGAKKRIYTPIEDIPALVKNAFISAEDKNFYTHNGLDFFSISKAFVINIKHLFEGKRLIGASTITQQVAKNFLLSNEVSLNRKIKEALLALRIEKILSKERILELYLNEIFLGQRSYGVAAASLNYFNKSLDELDLAEIAYLAGLPKGPNNYQPKKNKKAAIQRRNYVLQRMQKDNVITKKESLRASMVAIEQKSKKRIEKIYAPYFIEEVRRSLIEKYGEKSLYKEGLHVITTIDPVLQDIAIKELRKGLETYDKRLGWRGPIANIKNKNLTKDFEAIQKQYKYFPGLHNKTLGVVSEVTAESVYVKIIKDAKEAILPIKNIEKKKWIVKGIKKNNKKNFLESIKKNDVIVLSKKIGGYDSKYEIDQIPQVNGAIVALDPRNGRVLAMSGGYDFDGSEFNMSIIMRVKTGCAGLMIAAVMTAGAPAFAQEPSESHLAAARQAITALHSTDEFDAILLNAALQLKGNLIQATPDIQPEIDETVDEVAISLASRPTVFPAASTWNHWRAVSKSSGLRARVFMIYSSNLPGVPTQSGSMPFTEAQV